MTPRKPTQLLVDYSLHIAILILAIVCAIQKPLFIQYAPFDLIKRIAAYIIMALAMGGIMRMGEIDISQGRIMGFASLFAAQLLVNRALITIDIPMIDPYLLIAVVTAAAILLCALIGFINGWMVAKLKNPSWLSTLAMQLILYGVMLIILDSPLIPRRGSGISNTMVEFKNLVTHTTKIGHWAIPNYVWFAIGITIIVGLLWHRTKLGKNMKAVVENREASGNNGVNVSRTIILTFIIAGALCAISGVIECARVGGPGASAGSNAELDAICACLLGGFFLRGGKGNIIGVVIGVMFVQLASVALQWQSISANLVYLIKGGMILWAAAASTHRYLRESRKAEALSAQTEGDAEYDTQETDPAAP